MLLKIGDLDCSGWLTEYKIGYNTIVSDESGRNAQGDSTIDIITKSPKIKVFCQFGPMTQSEMSLFLTAIAPFIVTAQFHDPKTNSVQTITVYIGTPEIDRYPNVGGETIYKPFSLNFIEL